MLQRACTKLEPTIWVVLCDSNKLHYPPHQHNQLSPKYPKGCVVNKWIYFFKTELNYLLSWKYLLPIVLPIRVNGAKQNFRTIFDSSLFLGLSILNPYSSSRYFLCSNHHLYNCHMLTPVKSCSVSPLNCYASILADLSISHSESLGSCTFFGVRLLLLNTLSKKREGWIKERGISDVGTESHMSIVIYFHALNIHRSLHILFASLQLQKCLHLNKIHSLSPHKGNY